MTPQEVVDLLNEAFELDPAAIATLVATRIPCNNPLSEHPTIQVTYVREGSDKMGIGILGILNGLLVKEEKCVMFAYDDATQQPLGFRLGNADDIQQIEDL